MLQVVPLHLKTSVAMQSQKGNVAKSWALANYSVIQNGELFKEEDLCQLWIMKVRLIVPSG